MSEAKHTPGPWDWKQDKDNPLKFSISDGEMILWLDTDLEGYEEIAKANAQLIAAAPSMLDALEYLKEMASYTIGYKNNFPGIFDAIEKAESIINKAKGE
jgi:hypothetical protein